MIRKLIAFIFLLAFLTQTFSGFAIQINYFLNTKAFSKNCENKARPKMHCNGKCQMMKKIRQEEKKDQQSQENRSAGKNEVLSSKSFFCSVKVQINSIRKDFGIIQPGSPIDRNFSIFHPPQS